MPTETLPASKARGVGHRFHPAGNLRIRQPEHFLVAADAIRPDGVQGLLSGGGDGHDRALGLGVGLGSDDGDTPAAIVPACHVTPGQHRRFAQAQVRVGEDEYQGQVEPGAGGGLPGSF